LSILFRGGSPGDLLEPMQSSAGQYDAIIAADVFVYIGNLDSVFAAVRHALRPDGSFIFSTEMEQQGNGYALRESGRYGHADAYIRRLGEANGFTLHSREEVDLRMEAGTMIHGAVYVFLKS
jgi:predicted TPR repeat methyltransferase